MKPTSTHHYSYFFQLDNTVEVKPLKEEVSDAREIRRFNSEKIPLCCWKPYVR